MDTQRAMRDAHTKERSEEDIAICKARRESSGDTKPANFFFLRFYLFMRDTEREREREREAETQAGSMQEA